MRTSKLISFTLGSQQAGIERRPGSDDYSNAGTLNREETALDELLRAKVAAALADNRPSIPAKDVFNRLRARNVDEKTKRM